MTPATSESSVTTSIGVSVGIVTTIAVVALAAAPHVTGVNAVVAALLAGIVVVNAGRDRMTLHPVVSDALLKRVLKGAIVLLGATVDLRIVTELGTAAGITIGVAVTVALVTALPLGRRLGLGRRTSLLVGVGCAICGASAIAAVGPVIRAKREELGLALATIFTFNAVALVTLPALGGLLGLDAAAFGTWAGVAVHDTASAVAAGFAGGDEAGRVATLVKLSRTVLLVPLVGVLAVAAARRADTVGPGGDDPDGRAGGLLRVAGRSFPWFVAGFAAMAVAGTLGVLGPLVDIAGSVAEAAIVAVVAGIGLTLRWSRIAGIGGRSVVVGFVASVAVAAATLATVLAAA